MTEYFISMDDDFVITADTKLEDLLEIIEESGYDIIGGEVVKPNQTEHFDKWDQMARFYLTRSPDGFCYYRGKFDLPPMEKYPNCSVRDIVLNYFIGRVSTAGGVRMDPHFSRTGHKEFFLDALGELRIAGLVPIPAFGLLLVKNNPGLTLILVR